MKFDSINPTNDRVIPLGPNTLKLYNELVSTTDLDGAYVNQTLPAGYNAGDKVAVPGPKKFISNLIKDLKYSEDNDGTKCHYKAEITCNNGYVDPEYFELSDGKYSNVLMHECFDYLNGIINWKMSVVSSYATDTLNVVTTQIAAFKRNEILKEINKQIDTAQVAEGTSIHEQILHAINLVRANKVSQRLAVVMTQSTAYELMKTTLKDINGNLTIQSNDPTQMSNIFGATIKIVPDSDLKAPFVVYPVNAIQYYEACVVKPEIRAIINDKDTHDGTARIYERNIYHVRSVGAESAQSIDKDNNVIKQDLKYFVKGSITVTPLLVNEKAPVENKTVAK